MPADVEAWERAGLYRPGEPGDAERLALLVFLTERGATLHQLIEAHRWGSLPAVAGDLVRGQSAERLPVTELAARYGVPVDQLQRVLLAVGLPASDDTELGENLAPLLDAFEQGAALMGDEAILAFTRVLGASASNIAAAAVALFYAEMGPGSEREGADELARARASEEATLAFSAVPEVLSRVLVAQFERASRRAMAARGWSRPAVDGAPGAESVATEVVALGFVDLVGSTAWAAGLTLREHSLALSRFESAAWSSAVLADGRVVKMIGDEVFFAAPTSDAACRIAAQVCRNVAGDPLLPPARAAVGHGLVTSREGDFFGPLVNLVSRLVKAAEPGGMVVTEDVAGELDAGRWQVADRGRHELRGLEEPVRLFTATELTATELTATVLTDDEEVEG